DLLPAVSLAERIRAAADVANPASVLVRLLEHESQTRRLATDEARDACLDRFRSLRVLPEHEDRLAQRRRLFLHASRVGDEQPVASSNRATTGETSVRSRMACRESTTGLPVTNTVFSGTPSERSVARLRRVAAKWYVARRVMRLRFISSG